MRATLAAAVACRNKDKPMGPRRVGHAFRLFFGLLMNGCRGVAAFSFEDMVLSVRTGGAKIGMRHLHDLQ